MSCYRESRMVSWIWAGTSFGANTVLKLLAASHGLWCFFACCSCPTSIPKTFHFYWILASSLVLWLLSSSFFIAGWRFVYQIFRSILFSSSFRRISTSTSRRSVLLVTRGGLRPRYPSLEFELPLHWQLECRWLSRVLQNASEESHSDLYNILGRRWIWRGLVGLDW